MSWPWRQLSLVAAVVAYACAYDGWQMRVIDGEDAQDKEFPFFVTIVKTIPSPYDLISRTGSGSLISEIWTLTARHCINPSVSKDSPTKTRIVYGDHTIPINETKAFKFALQAIIIPTRFGDKQFRNDIALVRHDPIKVKAYGKISSVDYHSLFGRMVKYVGGGITEFIKTNKYDSRYYKRLYNRFVKVDNTRPPQVGAGVIVKCDSIIDRDGVGAYLCLAPKCDKKNQSAHPGDSGGPVLFKGKIVGVCTMGSGSGLGMKKTSNSLIGAGLTSVYTAVSPYLTWIQESIIIKTNCTDD